MADAQLVFDIFAKDHGASATLSKVGRSAAEASDKVERLDGQKVDLDTKPAVRGLALLNAEITKSQTHVKGLRDDFRKTGDTSLFKDIRKEQANLNKLTRWAKDFGDESDRSSKKVGAFGGAIGAIGTAFTKAIPATGALANPVVAGSAIAVAALATIPAGALVAGAALAGLGAGFLGLGAFALRGSKQVQAALKDLGDAASKELTSAASSLEGPFVAALTTLKGSVHRLAPDLRVMFDSVAPSVDNMVAAVDGLATRAMPGLEHAVAASTKVLDAFSAKLPETGDAISKLGQDLGDSADGGATALTIAMGLLNTQIGSTGEILKVTSSGLQVFTEGWGKFLTGPLPLLISKQGEVNKAQKTSAQSAMEYAEAAKLGGISSANAAEQQGRLAAAAMTASPLQKKLAEIMKTVGDTTKTAADRANALSDAWSVLTGGTIEAGRANIAVKEALAQAQAAVDGVRRSLVFSHNAWNLNTEAGRAAYSNYLDVVEAAKRAAIATYRNAVATKGDDQARKDAKAAYLTYIENLKETYRRANYSETAIRNMIGAAKAMPPQIAPKVSAPGAVAAKKQIEAIEQAIKDLKNKQVELIIDQRYQSLLSGKLDYYGHRIPGKASGGPVHPYQTYMVGERGPEMLTMGRSAGHITPNHQLPIGGPYPMVAINARGRGNASATSGINSVTNYLGTIARRHHALDASFNAGLAAQANGGGFGLGGSATSSVRAILAVARMFYPGAQVSSGYRPGAHDYHGRGLAADIVGGGVSGMNRIAQGFYGISGRLLELIHSPSWFVKNGQRVGAGYYRSVFGQHFNHVHVAARADALAGLGAGFGASFDSGGWLKPGWNPPMYNGLGRSEHLVPAGAGGGNTYNITVNVAPGGNPVEAGRQTVQAIQSYEAKAGKGWRR